MHTHDPAARAGRLRGALCAKQSSVGRCEEPYEIPGLGRRLVSRHRTARILGRWAVSRQNRTHRAPPGRRLPCTCTLGPWESQRPRAARRILVHMVHEVISTVPVLRANFVREPSTPVLLAAEPAVKTHVNRHVTSDRKAAIAAAAVAGARCALAILLQQARRQVEWRAWPRRRRGKQCRGQHVGAMSRRCPARHMQYGVCCLNDRLGPADAQSELRRAGHEATWSAVVDRSSTDRSPCLAGNLRQVRSHKKNTRAALFWRDKRTTKQRGSWVEKARVPAIWTQCWLSVCLFVCVCLPTTYKGGLQGAA